ncbi:extensin family protein [Tritonibacter mobilis]|uniref:extensin-like domain-containing protein n=1 Tax=Tritonibacter mobilis TaxID=379347 RepID=UPI0039A7115A
MVLIHAGFGLGAAAPETTPRPPLERGADPALTEVADVSAAAVALTVPAPQMRPHIRPVSAQIIAAAARPVDLAPVAPGATLRPMMRTPEFMQQVLFGRAKRRRGSVCGDIDIQGEEAGDIPGKLRGCGARDAVRVRSVSGVTLSRPALMTCETAKALNKWVSRDVETAFGRSNRVVQLRVAAGYSCRTRNNRPGAKISEHGRGRAIDISGFTLESGTTVSVLKGWRDRSTRKALQRLWKTACGPFRTVLGPEADIYHRDHFHLDVARHRSGRYCR